MPNYGIALAGGEQGCGDFRAYELMRQVEREQQNALNAKPARTHDH